MGGLKKFSKYLYNFLWVVLVVLIIFFATGIYLVNKHKEDIKDLSISRINEVVQTKISVDQIDVTFLRTFPYLSVVFHDVTVWSSHNFNRIEFQDIDTDRLFIAEKVYLKFNAIDLIRKNIRIRRIYAVNGETNILIDSEGKTNAQVLKARPEQLKNKDKKTKIFELEALKISDFNVSFNNLSKKTHSSSEIENLLLKGKFSKNKFSLGTHTSLVLHNFTRNGFRYANDYNINLRLILEVADSVATIEKGELSLNTMNLETKGNILLGKKPGLNIMLDSRNINISTLLRSFPQEWKEKIPFDADGRGDLALKVEGPITSTRVPAIQAVYVLNLNQVEFNKTSLRNLKLKGNYTNGDRQRPSTTEIDIDKFRIRDMNSDFEGSFNIKNLVNPDIALSLQGEIDAEKISEILIKDESIKIKGTIFPDIELTTKAGSFRDIDAENLSMAGIAGDMEFSNIDLLLPGDRSFTDINGIIGFAGDSWYPEFSLKSGEDELNVRAQLDYVLKYLMNKNQVLWMSGIIDGEHLDLSPFSSGKRKSEKTERIAFPERIAGKFDFSIDEMKAGKFSASELKGQLVYRRAKLDIPDISFRSMEGIVKGNATLVQNENGDFYLKSKSDLENISLSGLFENFNNFGQDNLRSDHVEGLITGNIDFNSIFDSTFSLRKDKILTEAELVIKKGELNDFKPAEKLSGFVGIEELRNIRFSTLRNTILIENNKMTIPEMDINSNAFDIKLSGIHNFSGYFDYKLKILLSEILTGRTKVKGEDFYIMEDQRRASIYLTISGKADDYNIKYDRQEAITAIRKDLKDEKSRLKNILHEEFGWFSRDSLKPSDKGSREFIIDWNEDSIATGKSFQTEKKSRKKKKRSDKKQDDEEIFQLEWDEGGG